MSKPDRVWRTRGGKREIRLQGKTVLELTNGVQRGASIRLTAEDAEEEAVRKVQDSAKYDGINYKEVTP